MREVTETGVSLTLCGRPGTGKTHLMVGVLKMAHRAGFTARYAVIEQIAGAVKDGYNARRSEIEILRPYVECDILGVDEVGQSSSVFVFELFAKIIVLRHQECRPTIVASNLSPDELEAAIGARAAERLRENGGLLLNLAWESQRI